MVGLPEDKKQSAALPRHRSRRCRGLGISLVLSAFTNSFALAASPAVSAAVTEPVPLDNSGAAPPDGGIPNAARAPDAPASSAGNVPPSPYANYRWKGINISLPLPGGTVDGDLFGARQKLADDYGIGYIGFTGDTVYANVLHAAHSLGGNQTYVGQRVTGLSQNFLAVTVDLSRYGISDGQIVAAAVDQAVSWNPLGPNSFVLGTLSYYQTFLNKRIELKFGLLANSFEFISPFTAGSISGGVFGPSGSIQTELGLSGTAYPTYGANVTAHITDYFYDKFGIGRSLNPDGTIVEHNNDRQGVKFTTPNAGLFIINEVGYLKPSAPYTLKTWVRLGPILSNARYVELNNPSARGNGNYAGYVLVDQQISQISSTLGEVYRGLYVGTSLEYATPTYNRFSQYYEARLYGLGIIPGRPHDQINFLVTDTVFSSFAARAARRAGQLAHGDSQAITFSYSAELFHGAFLNGGVGYVNNPTPIVYRSNTGSALNLIGGVSVFF